jgi:hypothetical protein
MRLRHILKENSALCQEETSFSSILSCFSMELTLSTTNTVCNQIKAYELNYVHNRTIFLCSFALRTFGWLFNQRDLITLEVLINYSTKYIEEYSSYLKASISQSCCKVEICISSPLKDFVPNKFSRKVDTVNERMITKEKKYYAGDRLRCTNIFIIERQYMQDGTSAQERTQANTVYARMYITMDDTFAQERGIWDQFW